MDSSGGAVANLTPPREYEGVPYQGHDDSPSWSPDGRIAFTHTFLPNAGGLPAVWTVAETDRVVPDLHGSDPNGLRACVVTGREVRPYVGTKGPTATSR